jgi:hypothetical protein
MSELRFNVRLDDPPDFRADAILGDGVFEVLVDPRDLRRLRATFMELARVCASTSQDRRGILILDEPQISEETLYREWDYLRIITRPEIFDRMSLVLRREEHPIKLYPDLTQAEQDSIEAVAEHKRLLSLRPARRPSEAFFDVLRVLLIHWIRKTGPLTSKQLCAESGFTYPTIATALEKLESHLTRHSDRRVELHSFPKDAWFKLVAQSEKVRASQGYADRSGRPRSPEALLDRLRGIHGPDIGVGGVLGARHYLPGLDLAGTPRLDLVFHTGKRKMRKPNDIARILRKLDPALKPAEPGEPCQLVIHTLFRPESFFTDTDNGPPWADEVECLLDLHDSRLEQQAVEFLEKLIQKSKS